MTPREVEYKDKIVVVVSLVSRSGRIHMYVRRYMGRFGQVVGEAKNGMLLIQFGKCGGHRAIPAGCVVLASDMQLAGVAHAKKD